MKKTIYLIHKDGKSRTIRMGFCWPGFLIPTLWAVSEGLWRPFAFTLLSGLVSRFIGDVAKYYGNDRYIGVGLIVYLLTMLFFGLYGKKWLFADLLKHGYVDNSPFNAEAQIRRST